MKSPLFLILLLLCVARADAQCDWRPLNPQPTIEELRDVCFVTAELGWAVGVGGTILHTSDAGAHWLPERSGRSEWLMSVFFLDANTGWVAGMHGVILNTTNGGADWAPQQSGVTQSLWSIRFADASVGCAVGGGGTVLLTTDGGATWTQQTSGTTANLFALELASGTQFWTAGDFTILHSGNGGRDWTSKKGSLVDIFYSVRFLDEDTGFVGSYRGQIAKTTDGGSTWNQSTKAKSFIYSIRSSGDAVLAAGPSDVLISRDRGNHWNTVPLANGRSPRAAAMSDTAHFWVVGAAGSVSHSSDGGRNWQDQTGMGFPALSAVCVTGPGTAVAVGAGNTVAFLSTDRGSWRLEHAGDWVDLLAVSFVDSSTGWVAGTSCIRKTTDRGRTWINQSDSARSIIAGLHFINRDLGWAVGNGLQGILATRDGGAHWNVQRTGGNGTLLAVRFLDEQQGWAVGVSLRTLHTTDGGEHWLVQDSGSGTAGLSVLCCVDARTVWAGGWFGTLRRTTDGGSTWNTILTPEDAEDIHSLHFIDSARGWIAYRSAMYSTTDAGGTWTRDSSYRGGVLAVDGRDPSNAWAVGASGLVMTRACATSAAESLPPARRPLRFTCWPNPLTRVATLSCDLPEAAQARLEVYDLIGTRVAVLLDAFLPAGMPAARFDASTLPAGVYRAVLTVVSDGARQTQSIPLVIY